MSIGYDLMFMYQHYILYSTKNKDVYNDEEEIEDKFVDNACKEEYKKVCSNDNVYAVDNSAKK